MAFFAEYKHDIAIVKKDVGEFWARFQVVTQFVYIAIL